MSLVNSMDSEPDRELRSLIIQTVVLLDSGDSQPEQTESELSSLITQTISLVISMDFDSQPKPQSELISLITEMISLLSSISNSDPESELVSLITEKISFVSSVDSDSDSEPEPELGILPLIAQLMSLRPEIRQLIGRMIILAMSMILDLKLSQLISLCPQMGVRFEQGRFRVTEMHIDGLREEECRFSCQFLSLGGEDNTHFWCGTCNGDYHGTCDKAPLEVDHLLDRKHLLQLVLAVLDERTRECYCCDEDLLWIFYYCADCDIAMNIACVEKPPVLNIDQTKWHEHPLALFPRQASLTCNLCALADARSPFYMCPPCDFVVHQKCISLPRVIRISRHPHRISFTPSFNQDGTSCGVCRKEINRYYGGFSCIKNGCSYAAHSRCATQSNVWDGVELEGVPEEVEEDLEPFVRISDGIIQHFSHQHHHLILDENTDREYDENKLCQACITPIYFGNFYSCMQCDFILHDECANLRRKIHHPIHPHMLTLGEYIGVRQKPKICSACPWLCTVGFFYECGNQGCEFQLHVQCTSISEPLVHPSHMHPLFLTSKPEEEQRRCSVCKKSGHCSTNESFNCIEECDFALCFICATIPHKVRYKHDKHILTLSYGEELSTMEYWCEACEENINPKERFYMCDEYCCVTLHIECLIGKDVYMKPDSSFYFHTKPIYSRYRPMVSVQVWANNHHMCRPICALCEKRCPHNVIVQKSEELFCSTLCLVAKLDRHY